MLEASQAVTVSVSAQASDPRVLSAVEEPQAVDARLARS